MTRRLVLLALVALVALWCAGPRSHARLALALGQPALALRFAEDPALRGVLLHRLGRYAEADAAFAEAGRAVTYNRAITLALTGDYALSVAYFDAVLFASPQDRDARRNRDIVAALVEPVIGEAQDGGRIRALVAAEASTAPVADGNPWRQTQEHVRKPIDSRALKADDTWLRTLTDEPGAFLKARLQAEYERREAEGLVAGQVGQPW